MSCAACGMKISCFARNLLLVFPFHMAQGNSALPEVRTTPWTYIAAFHAGTASRFLKLARLDNRVLNRLTTLAASPCTHLVYAASLSTAAAALARGQPVHQPPSIAARLSAMKRATLRYAEHLWVSISPHHAFVTFLTRHVPCLVLVPSCLMDLQPYAWIAQRAATIA